MSAILFQINGSVVPADDASWYQIAPCGCTCGVLSAVVGDEVMATEDHAWKEHYPNAESRRRAKADGFRQELGLHADVRERMTGDCKHSPRWGVQKTPVPEGYRWARADDYPRPGRRKHLVAGQFEKERLHAPSHPSLCDAKAWCWSSAWYDVDDLAECVRCQRAAKAQVAA